jgi:hypothetical protein
VSEYIHHGTCDSCAEGDKPLREIEDGSDAWICEECYDREERGVLAAAEAMRDAAREGETNWYMLAQVCLKAYFITSGSEVEPS